MQIVDTNFKRNAIGFLRLFLSVVVIFSHGLTFGSFGKDPIAEVSAERLTIGSLAVSSFFFLSGLLITRSWLGNPSWKRYLWHRCLRIFPGYWVCLCIVAFLLGPLVLALEGGSASEYFRWGADGPFSYVGRNFWLDVEQQGIWNLAKNLSFNGNLNVSLWTLLTEFRCYLLLLILGLSKVLERSPALVAGLLGALFLAYLGLERYSGLASVTLVQIYHVVFFLAGTVTYLYRDKIVLKSWVALVAMAAIPVSFLFYPLTLFILPVALPYALLWVAFSLPITKFASKNDLSYGFYIYAAPIQIVLLAAGLTRYGLVPYLVLTVLCTFPLALLSWKAIEQPALSLKHLNFSRLRGWLVPILSGAGGSQRN